MNAGGQTGIRTDPIPFNRDTLQHRALPMLHEGKWGNADLRLFDDGGRQWVVKDFAACPWVVRHTWGRFMVWRELRTLRRLEGIAGMPRDGFRLDALAYGYRFEPGQSLKEVDPTRLDTTFFLKLEKLVQAMNDRGVVHLDLRHATNILITDAREPMLLDFQSSLFLDGLPAWLQGILKDVDLSGVYKHWYRALPATLEGPRLELLLRVRRRRKFWIFKGYSFPRPDLKRPYV
jgi:hypothetical protein